MTIDEQKQYKEDMTKLLLETTPLYKDLIGLVLDYHIEPLEFERKQYIDIGDKKCELCLIEKVNKNSMKVKYMLDIGGIHEERYKNIKICYDKDNNQYFNKKIYVDNPKTKKIVTKYEKVYPWSEEDTEDIELNNFFDKNSIPEYQIKFENIMLLTLEDFNCAMSYFMADSDHFLEIHPFLTYEEADMLYDLSRTIPYTQ